MPAACPEGTKHRLFLRRASVLVTVADAGDVIPVRGVLHSRPRSVSGGSVVVGLDGLVCDAGPDAQVASRHARCVFETEHDLGLGACVVPGLCDAHTHPVWAGNRVGEYCEKLAGATYMEIHARGGGIHKTVRCTSAASEDDLLADLEARVGRMVRLGTTLAECKSGYGLTLDPELKMLRVIERGRVSQSGKCDLVATYLGAHAVPEGRTPREAARDIIDVQIPEIVRCKERGEIGPEMIDVFHETGVFVEETREILEAGARAGMQANFHGDELTHVGGAELGAELGALAVSHLEEISDAGIAALAKPESRTAAVLLPTTAYVLKLRPPDARKMIDAGVPVALGSDFNPNAHCLSMPMTMNMACTLYKMTVAESLVAATANAAYSMGRGGTHGVIRPGSKGDMLVIAAEQWESLVYEMVDPPIGCVIKEGKVVSGSFK